LTLTLQDALARTQKNNPEFRAALTAQGVAHEDRVQARAAFLPTVNYTSQFLYTQGNGTPSGRFIANNGVHEYLSQGVVQQTAGDAPCAEYPRNAAAHAVARAKAEIAARGLVVTVVQAYFGLQAAEAKAASTQAAS